MVERRAWNISKFGNEWVAQEMDTNPDEMADELLSGLWWLVKLIFFPITLSVILLKRINKWRVK